MIRIWYHGNCYDGFGAAWAASKLFGFGPHILYQAVFYGQPPPTHEAGDDVLILDFSFPRATLLALKEKVAALRVIDHHKTAEEDLAGLDFCTFDMKRSGAGLAWDILCASKPRPKIIDLLEDRDLWSFRYGEETKRFHAFIRAHPFDFSLWDTISDLLVSAPDRIFGLGEGMLMAEAQTVKMMNEKSWIGELGSKRCALVNATCYWSEVGYELLKQWPGAQIAASYMVLIDGSVQWSLRSRGDEDVSAIAKLFGGGGHKSAAGFISTVGFVASVLRGAAPCSTP